MTAVAIVCTLYALGMVASCIAMIVGHKRGQAEIRNAATALPVPPVWHASI